MTTAQLIAHAKAKVTEAMVLIEEARQIIGSQPSDEPSDDDNTIADRFNRHTGMAYRELYEITR